MRKELSRKELEEIEDRDLENWGRYLTDTQGTRLEEELAVKVDHKVLLKLLGYYGNMQRQDKRNQQAHIDYIRILVQLARTYPARTFFTNEAPNVREEESNEFLQIWKTHVDENLDDADIIGNAGLFVQSMDKELSVEYLRKAVALDPHNHVWSRTLCYWSIQLDYMKMDRYDLAEDILYYGALDRNDAAHGVSIARQSNLQAMCKAALALGRLKLAEKYARLHNEFVDQILDREQVDAWQQFGRSIFGLVHLRRNELELAKACLLPVLRDSRVSKGLAAELLMRGERELVIEYVRQLSDGCITPLRASRYISLIKGGRNPLLRYMSDYSRSAGGLD